MSENTSPVAPVQNIVLLPCPFCGDKAVVEYVKEVFFRIGCKGGNCLCSIYTQATAHPLHQMPARINRPVYESRRCSVARR